MGLDKQQWTDCIVAPAVRMLPFPNRRARALLLLATGMRESEELTYIKQIRGPALGLYQIEPTTIDYLVNYMYMQRNEKLTGVLMQVKAPGFSYVEQMPWNLMLGTILAAVRYWVVPEPLPAEGDANGMASYWGRYYNTRNVEKEVKDFARRYKEAMSKVLLPADLD